MLGASLVDILKSIQEKKISHTEVNNYFRKRIDVYDQKINSFLVIHKQDDNDSAQNIVSQDGARFLHGLALAIKDNFSTAGLQTTASSKVLEGYIAPYDATVVKKLKNAGAIGQGKTNMDAWAHGSSTETSDYGPTKNPYNIKRVAGGSSGGSGAAVAAYLTPAAIGSETAGSIRGPAAWSGVVGLKPTYGRVSRYGVIAMGSSWDCPGPMTATVEDNAYLLKQIAGQDKYDATSSGSAVPDYSNEIKKNKKFKIGIAESYFDGVDKDVMKSVDSSLSRLTKL